MNILWTQICEYHLDLDILAALVDEDLEELERDVERGNEPSSNDEPIENSVSNIIA